MTPRRGRAAARVRVLWRAARRRHAAANPHTTRCKHLRMHALPHAHTHDRACTHTGGRSPCARQHVRVLHPPWGICMCRYFNTPPPSAPSQSSSRGAGSAAGSSSGQLPSFRELEAEAARTPCYSRFVSPSLWVRAMCAGALAFRVRIDGSAGGKRTARDFPLLRALALALAREGVQRAAAGRFACSMLHGCSACSCATPLGTTPPMEARCAKAAHPLCVRLRAAWTAIGVLRAGQAQEEGLAAVRSHVLCLTDIWLAHMAHDTSPAAEASDRQLLSPALLEELRHASGVLRNYVRHDPLTPMLLPVFGEAGVNAWIETMAGER